MLRHAGVRQPLGGAQPFTRPRAHAPAHLPARRARRRAAQEDWKKHRSIYRYWHHLQTSLVNPSGGSWVVKTLSCIAVCTP